MAHQQKLLLNFKTDRLQLTKNYDFVARYSGANWKVYEYCFMKQKCQLQIGVAEYKMSPHN